MSKATPMHSACVAAVQMVSGLSVARNLERAEALVAEAVGRGAELVLLPEYFCLMGQRDTDKLAIAEPFVAEPVAADPRSSPTPHPLQTWAARLAQHHRIWLVAGTLPLQSSDAGRVRNAMLVYGPDGRCAARYDKLHLFALQTPTETFDEGQTIEPGSAVGLVQTPAGRTLLSVCYDLRFPELFRWAGQQQAIDLILMSAAFTAHTGRAHWELLVRSRAVENQCWVLASAQGGLHENGRNTWGHSMLVDPWGEVVECLPSGEGVVLGRVDPAITQRVRLKLPALQHQRLHVSGMEKP